MLLDHIARMDVYHTGTARTCDRLECGNEANYQRVIYYTDKKQGIADLCKKCAYEDIATARDSEVFKVVGLSDGVRFIR